ncbi:MAG TPA: M13 family metallopeptidase [Bacteroidia bacterium]|jgi:putative endopeptidase|nr:M13 family metallopeptidase [Bacteroidia bacterium]
MKKVSFYAPAICFTLGLAMFSTSCKHETDAEKYKGEVALNYFDTTVKPQDNFYKYVNGNWLKNNPIPASEAAWGSFNVLNDSILARLRKILEVTAADKSLKHGSVEQKIGDLFATMMDSVSLNKNGITPLNGEFAKINAISDNKSLWAEAAHLMKIGPDVMFGFGVGQDPKISAKEVCTVTQGGMSLPAKDYYTEENPMFKMLRGKFVEYATQIFQQMGETADMASKDAQKILDIETQMANSSMSSTEERNIQAQYNKMPMTDLEKVTPNIDWATIRESFGIKSIDTIIVAQPLFMKQLSEMAKSVPMDDWKTYLRFHLLSSEADKLSDTLNKISFNFWGKTFTGATEMQPRWKRSVESTSGGVGQLLGQLYVAKYFSPEAKQKVNEMVTNIIAAYKERINKVTWMSPETKKYALAKLDKITLKLCYPDKWKDYSTLDIERDALVLNSFRISEFETNFEINKLGKPVDRTEWGMSPQTVNAYYNPSMNEIVFPAAIMQPPFFDPNRDDAMNYGAMGSVIGHELTHGFDDQGSQFDAQGNLHKWWTDQDSTSFHKKLQVVINQFNNYVIDSMHIKGELTIGENTADFGGLTIAYNALENQLKEHPEGIVDGFTPEQRFFIAWAQAWRENIRPDYLKQLITTNPHSPAIFRTNGPLSNMPEFYQAFSVSSHEHNADFKGFDIKPGDGMYRSDSVRASIW